MRLHMCKKMRNFARLNAKYNFLNINQIILLYDTRQTGERRPLF